MPAGRNEGERARARAKGDGRADGAERCKKGVAGWKGTTERYPTQLQPFTIASCLSRCSITRYRRIRQPRGSL